MPGLLSVTALPASGWDWHLTASSFPRERERYCCAGRNTYVLFFSSGSRGAKFAYLEHSSVACSPAANPGTGT